jgi:MbtH protein
VSIFDVTDGSVVFKVVLNHEEQYSIWPNDRDIPSGWKDAGKAGTKQQCLDYIKAEWTDMRPLSLRLKMDSKVRSKTT